MVADWLVVTAFNLIKPIIIRQRHAMLRYTNFHAIAETKNSKLYLSAKANNTTNSTSLLNA